MKRRTFVRNASAAAAVASLPVPLAGAPTVHTPTGGGGRWSSQTVLGVHYRNGGPETARSNGRSVRITEGRRRTRRSHRRA